MRWIDGDCHARRRSIRGLDWRTTCASRWTEANSAIRGYVNDALVVTHSTNRPASATGVLKQWTVTTPANAARKLRGAGGARKRHENDMTTLQTTLTYTMTGAEIVDALNDNLANRLCPDYATKTASYTVTSDDQLLLC